MHVESPLPHAEIEHFEDMEPPVPLAERLGVRLALTVVLPVAVVLLALLVVQRTSGSSGTDELAQARIVRTLELTNELLEQRTETFQGMLSTLLTQDAATELVELWEAGELERAALTTNRLERSCEQLLELQPGILGIEIYSQKGKLFLSVAGGGVPPSSFDVKSEEWFGTAERQGDAVSCDREGILRITRRHSEQEEQGVLYGSLVIDLAHLTRPVTQFAASELDGARLTLETDAGEIFLADTLATTQEDVLSAATPATFCRGSLRIEQGARSALASTTTGSSSRRASLILAGLLLATLWVALQQTVLAPLAASAATAHAFRDGTELTEALDRPQPALALRPFFAAATQIRRLVARLRKMDPAETPLPHPQMHEIALVDRALRDAVAVARESETARRDLTQTFDRRVAEYTSTLMRGKTDAEAASYSKTEFLASLTNGLRLPLGSAIRGAEELLEGELSQEQRALAKAAHSSASEVLKAFDEVRDFTALETGRIELRTIEFDLHHAVEDAMDMLAAAAGARRLEVVLEILPGVPRRVVGDPTRVCQVITVLVESILDATEAGDTLVRVSPSHAAATQLLFEVRGTGAHIGAGTGPGSEMFDPFAPSEPGTSRGAGLGPAICRQLVQRMQGEISWRSTPSEGTTFWFTVGLQSVGNQAPAVTGLERRRVLVVDDNAASRRVLSSKLAHWGVETFQAAGAQEAISLLQESSSRGEPFEAALIDLEMPDLDGLDLARWIKDDVDHMELPLILLAGGERDLGADASLFSTQLKKPVRNEPLSEALRAALPEHAQANPAGSGAQEAAQAGPKLQMPLKLDPDAGPSFSTGALAGRPLPTTSTARTEPAPARPSVAREPAAAADPVEEPPAPLPQAATPTSPIDPATLNGSEWSPEEPTRVLLAQLPGADSDDVARILDGLGYELVMVDDGQDVLELLDTEPFHALLIDRDVAGMDGPKVTRRVRNRPDLKASMPIIGLTRGSVLEDRDGCVQAGMDDCLQKPTSAAELGAILKRWVTVCSHLSSSELNTIAMLRAQRVAGDA